MPTAAPVRMVKVSETDETYDPYVTLIGAIIARAVADAQGETSPARHIPPAVLVAEARQWLADEAAVRDLIELCGSDAAVVLRRVRQILEKSVPTSAEPQLTLF